MDETADEWFTYGFSPLIWSAGGQLISADGRVDGVLNSDTNVEVLSAWRRLFEEDLASTSPVDPDPFGSGKTAMDWSGHWMARRHEAAKGEALGVMPLAAFRTASRGGLRQLVLGHLVEARDPDAAAAWLRWVTDAATGIVPIVRANGAVPARARAFDAVPEFGEEPYRLFRTTPRDVRPSASAHAALRDAQPARCRGASRHRARGRRAGDPRQGGGESPAGRRPAVGPRSTMGRRSRARLLRALPFLLPALVLLGLFVVWPMLRAVAWSLTDADLLRPGRCAPGACATTANCSPIPVSGKRFSTRRGSH